MTGVERLRDDPDFRRYWAGRVVSLAGSATTYVAMPVLVYQLSGSPFLTALVTALEAVPYVALGLLAGVLTDRWDRRRTMVVADLLSAAVLFSIPVAAWLDALTVPHVLVAAFAGHAVFVFFDGANFGALPTLVGRGSVARANAAVWSASSLVEIAVPALAGASLAVWSPATLLAVDALSFAASALAIRGIRRALDDRARHRAPLSLRSVRTEIVEGLRFLVGHAGVRTLTVVGMLQSVAGGGFVALMVLWSDQVLGSGQAGLRFGLLYGAWAVGGLAASLALPRLLRRLPAAAITLYALPASAVLGLLTASATSWTAGVVSLLAWGAAYMLVVINAVSYRQEVTPEPLLGRVNVVARMLAWGIGWTVGAVGAGAVADVLGVRAGMLASAAAVVPAVVVAWASPLRQTRAALR